MDTDSILLLRLFGYLLNAVLFVSVILKYKHHALALIGWIVFLGVLMLAVLLRYRGRLTDYLFLIDYVGTPLLYINAVFAAVVLLRHNGHR